MAVNESDLLDALNYALGNGGTPTPYYPYDYSMSGPITSLPGFIGCEHDWKQYKGLIEEFQYCTKCNEKKDGN